MLKIFYRYSSVVLAHSLLQKEGSDVFLNIRYKIEKKQYVR